MNETIQNIQSTRQSRSIRSRASHNHKEMSLHRDAPHRSRRQEIRMADEPSDMEELFYVGVRKYGLDENTPWWERWFFRALYLPFVRWSFKWLHIPAQGTLHEDGSFSWVEHIGIATDERSAREMCKGEFYVVHRLPVNGELPNESLQYKGHVYPKAMTPARYIRRCFRLTAVRNKEVAMLEEVNQRADKLLEVARAG